MTPEQALQYVANACANYQGTRQDHQLLDESIRVLKGLLPNNTPEPETKEPKPKRNKEDAGTLS